MMTYSGAGQPMMTYSGIGQQMMTYSGIGQQMMTYSGAGQPMMTYSGIGQQMMTRASLLLPLLLTLFTQLIAAHESEQSDWNYDTSSSDGPCHWYENYPACGGSMQSPINIDTGGAWFDPQLRPMDLGDYSIVDHVQMSLVNRGGHTAEISYSGKALYIRGGDLLGEYQLDQLHFHWGPRFRNGSEHKLDWRHYPMELHIVHHQRKMSDTGAAAKEPNGLAVYAVLFKVVPHDNSKLNEIIRHLDQIKLSGEEITIASFPLLEILPATVARLFYRYDGSLTTPPCYESVIWTIAVDFIEISEDQINKFRSLEGKEGQHLTDTHRPIQRLNGRKVRTTVHTKYIYVSSHAVRTHVNNECLFSLMLLALMLTMGFYSLSCC